MSSVHAPFPDDQKPPKRSRFEPEPTTPPSTLSPAESQSQEVHFISQSHPTTSKDDDDDDDEIGDGDESVGVSNEQNDEAMRNRASRVSYGSVSLIGRRRVMEDAITVALPGLPCVHEFFAVYDGQGGPRVSTACHERLHLILSEEISRQGAGNGVDWRSVMKECFYKMDEVVKGGNDGLVEDEFEVVSVETVGSTATIVLVGEEEIVVANCGDSRAVLFSGGSAFLISRDHKFDNIEERMRFESEDLSNNLDLRITRAIGHHGHSMKHYLIPDPEVEVHHITQSDKFLIIASHGLWDVVSNEDACEVVKNCLDGHIRRSFQEDFVTIAATTLAEFALARGSKENISLIVVVL